MKNTKKLSKILALGLVGVMACSAFVLSGCGDKNGAENGTEIESNTEVKEKITADENGMMKVYDRWYEAVKPLDEQSVNNFASKLQKIVTDNLTENNRLFYGIIPDKSYYVKDEIATFLDYDKMTEILRKELSNMTEINIVDHLDAESFYLTDNHWRQEKLDAVAKEIGKTMGFSVNAEFTPVEYTEFKGIYQDLMEGVEPETLTYLESEYTKNASVDDFQNKDFHKVYNLEKMEGKIAYDVFLSGATPLTTITTGVRSDEELVIFRDSFGSSLTPLLLEGYNKITLVDLRYMASSLLPDYVDFGNADVLFLFSDRVVNQSMMLK